MFIGYLYLVVVVFYKIDMEMWNCFGHEKELIWNLQCNVLNVFQQCSWHICILKRVIG
jgi:hypothetical protein